MKDENREERAKEFTCEICGKAFDLDSYDPKSEVAQLMAQKHICYGCAYWEVFFRHHHDDFEIVDGKVYFFGDQLFTVKAKRLPVTIRYILHPDRTVRQLNNAYCIGTVPAHLNMADTGRFICRAVFTKIERWGEFDCRAIGCYDRYRCWWYDKDVQEPDGPWNVIPKNYKVGSEHCESFIDKKTMFNL